ncbi:hypothetical protein CASFOL_013248 [Castilleja foliolosa]|uniref:F-box domain-containing protein n=1 Tax=Castilleja foliolosa TaxID=1961234 RepID=A0ABD3DJG6_9LAMI
MVRIPIFPNINNIPPNYHRRNRQCRKLNPFSIPLYLLILIILVFTIEIKRISARRIILVFNQIHSRAMANSVLPEELVLCILTRLPVKTIIRFKCVCKPCVAMACGPNNKIVSLGFGYDAMTADFKVVMIVTSINLKFVEIYSANLDSWITIDVGFQFSWLMGTRFWCALMCWNWYLRLCLCQFDHWMGLVNWDALEYEDTKIVTKTDVNFVDWNGALGALITNHEVEYRKGIASSIECSARIQCVGVWVFDDIQRIWRNYHTFGPIDVDVNKVLNCVKNEKILGTISFDKLCVLDLETGIVKELFDGAGLGYSFEVYGYTESFAHVNGMEKVVVKYERNDIYD